MRPPCETCLTRTADEGFQLRLRRGRGPRPSLQCYGRRQRRRARPALFCGGGGGEGGRATRAEGVRRWVLPGVRVVCLLRRESSARGLGGGGGKEKGPPRRPQQPFGRRLEDVVEAVGAGYCRLQMPLRLALGVRGTVAGHRLGALERGGGYLPPFRCIPWGVGGGGPPVGVGG